MKLNEMFMKTFGLTLKDESPKSTLESIDIRHEDGATEVLTSYGGIVGLTTDLFNLPTNEVELIKTYRSLSLTSDFERALNEIKNEVLIFNANDIKAIDISFDENITTRFNKNIVDKIKQEFEIIYSDILDFSNKGLELFTHWYVDGRLFLHKIVDKDNLKNGIQKVIRIDPLKIRKVVQYPQPNQDGVYDLNLIQTYFVFSDTTDVYNARLSRNMVINKDAITYIDSGIYDQLYGTVLSHIWKSIVPYNNMKMMEEALIVYRVVRSPERRVFYINVGNLSKAKAEEYIKELMNRFKNKLVYDSKTGAMVDKKNILSMAEDFWLPRRDDGKGTEIQSLPGAANLGSIDDVNLFKQKFLESLNVPMSRFRDDSSGFTFGRNIEISRDEYRFKKFLDRLRNRFVFIFEDILKTQLLLKNIIVESDWQSIKKSLSWRFSEDNNFVQWKEAELLENKITSLAVIDPFVGKYFTKEWAMRNVMQMSDDVIEAMLSKVEATNNTATDEF